LFTSNYLRNRPRVLPWYNLGFTQFLRHGDDKLIIAQTQCSQGYQKLVEKYWLRKKISINCQVETMVHCRLELQTLDGNCVFGQCFLCAFFLFMSVCHSLTLKGKTNTHIKTLQLGKTLGLIQGYTVTKKRGVLLTTQNDRTPGSVPCSHLDILLCVQYSDPHKHSLNLLILATTPGWSVAHTHTHKCRNKCTYFQPLSSYTMEHTDLNWKAFLIELQNIYTPRAQALSPENPSQDFQTY
jgi:hypothetical protein